MRHSQKHSTDLSDKLLLSRTTQEAVLFVCIQNATRATNTTDTALKSRLATQSGRGEVSSQPALLSPVNQAAVILSPNKSLNW